MTDNAFVHHMRGALGRAGSSTPWLIPADIYESWMRCLARGLDPRAPPRDLVDTTSALSHAREKHDLLRRVARVEIELLHRAIAGPGYALALAAPDGLVLDKTSDHRFDVSPFTSAVQPGSLWSEDRCGTNGIGTTALLRKRLAVIGHEHFFDRFAGLACAAAPIFAPDGRVAGILDASCDRRMAHPHTSALVATAATQIENALLRERHRDDIVVALHVSGDMLGTRATGLVALDPGGVIRGANTAARAMLRRPAPLEAQTFATIFATPLDDFLIEGRRRDRVTLVTHDGTRLAATIENARVLEPTHRAIHPRTRARFVAEDANVARISREVEAAARRRIPILIRGETGTGKEQMARHAHEASGRRGAFVPVNCASLPASLVEAELFGYVDGAFTGARRGGADGLATQADGGTLFLDEIGDMPVALQAVLLRFLDDFTVRPVGGTGSKVDVFLVSATNAGLDKAIAEGRFRADLLYRLNTLEVTLPTLSERGDFALIVDHLLAQIDPEIAITDAARESLAAAAWPGNVRQLHNMLARLTLSVRDSLIDEAAVTAAVGARSPADPIGSSLKESQRSRILATYERSGGNISETSRRLNVSRNTVYRALGEKRRQHEAEDRDIG